MIIDVVSNCLSKIFLDMIHKVIKIIVKKPSLHLRYRYHNSNQYLRVENIGNVPLNAVKIKCLEKTNRKYQLSLVNDDVMSDVTYNLEPGQYIEGKIGYYPLCFDYPNPPIKIKVLVSFNYGNKTKKYEEEVLIDNFY